MNALAELLLLINLAQAAAPPGPPQPLAIAGWLTLPGQALARMLRAAEYREDLCEHPDVGLRDAAQCYAALVIHRGMPPELFFEYLPAETLVLRCQFQRDLAANLVSAARRKD